MMRRVRARLVVLPVAVFVLSLALIWAPGTPAAQALVPTPSPVEIGQTLKGPAGKTFIRGAITCVSGGPLCAAITAARVGLLAYETRDVWMLIVKGLLGAKQSAGGSQVRLSLVLSISGPDLIYQYFYTTTPYSQFNVNIQYKCRTPATGTITSGTMTNQFVGGTSPSGTGSKTICGASADLIYARIFRTAGDLDYIVGTEVPGDVLSQTATVDCKKADGTIEAITATWTGHPDKIQIPSCVEHLPGSSPVGVTLGAGWPGAEQTIADFVQAPGIEEQYPSCFTPAGVLNGACRVRVWVDGQPCAVGVPGCSTWTKWEDDTGGSVQCKWGPYVVPLSECKLLKQAYKPNTGTQTLTKVDPETGDSYDPRVDTPPSTGTESGTKTFPEEGVNPETMPSPGASTDTDTASCWGTGWSWNPVSWVLVPVKCALKWAFVPDVASWGWTSFVDQLVARPPTSVMVDLVGIFGGVADGFSGAGSCGVLADFGDGMSITCAKIRSIGGYTAAYGLVQVGIVGLGAFTIFHILRSSISGGDG